MPLSNYLENKLIDSLFRETVYTPPTVLYIALCTVQPTPADTGSTIIEVNSDEYIRQGITTGVSSWYTTQLDTTSISVGTSGITGNAISVSWTAVDWVGLIVAVALCDAETDGNLLYYTSIPSTEVMIRSQVILAPNTLRVGFR